MSRLAINIEIGYLPNSKKVKLPNSGKSECLLLAGSIQYWAEMPDSRQDACRSMAC